MKKRIVALAVLSPALALAAGSLDGVAGPRVRGAWGWASSVHSVRGEPGRLILTAPTEKALERRQAALAALARRGVPALTLVEVGTLGGKPAAICSATLGAYDDSEARWDAWQTATSLPDLDRIEKAALAGSIESLRLAVAKDGHVTVADAVAKPEQGGLVPPLSPAEKKKLQAYFAAKRHEVAVAVQAREVMREGEDDPASARQEADFELATFAEIEREGVVGALDLQSKAWNNSHLGSIDPSKLAKTGETFRRGSYGIAREVELKRLPEMAIEGGRAAPLLYQSSLAIDTDGAGTAHLHDEWGQDATTLQDSHGRSLDPSKTPFFVLPSGFRKKHPEIKLGDVAAVFHDGKVSYAIFGDEGPPGEVGEGSVLLAKSLGIDPDGDSGGAPSGVTWLVFPGSTFGETVARNDLLHPEAFAAKIRARGAELLKRAGGAP